MIYSWKDNKTILTFSLKKNLNIKKYFMWPLIKPTSVYIALWNIAVDIFFEDWQQMIIKLKANIQALLSFVRHLLVSSTHRSAELSPIGTSSDKNMWIIIYIDINVRSIFKTFFKN